MSPSTGMPRIDWPRSAVDGDRTPTGQIFLTAPLSIDAQQHLGVGGAAEHQRRRRVGDLGALQRARVMEIAVGDARAAEEEHLQEPVEQDGDLAEEERAVDVGRDQHVVEREQRHRQHGRGAEDIVEVGDRGEPPLVAVQAEDQIDRGGVGEKDRQVLELGESRVERSALEAHEKRQHDRRGGGDEIVQDDQISGAGSISAAASFHGVPNPTLIYAISRPAQKRRVPAVHAPAVRHCAADYGIPLAARSTG